MLVIPTPEIDDKHSHPVGSSEAAPRAHTRPPPQPHRVHDLSVLAGATGDSARTRARTLDSPLAHAARALACVEKGLGAGGGGAIRVHVGARDAWGVRR